MTIGISIHHEPHMYVRAPWLHNMSKELTSLNGMGQYYDAANPNPPQCGRLSPPTYRVILKRTNGLISVFFNDKVMWSDVSFPKDKVITAFGFRCPCPHGPHVHVHQLYHIQGASDHLITELAKVMPARDF